MSWLSLCSALCTPPPALDWPFPSANRVLLKGEESLKVLLVTFGLVVFMLIFDLADSRNNQLNNSPMLHRIKSSNEKELLSKVCTG